MLLPFYALFPFILDSNSPRVWLSSVLSYESWKMNNDSPNTRFFTPPYANVITFHQSLEELVVYMGDLIKCNKSLQPHQTKRPSWWWWGGCWWWSWTTKENPAFPEVGENKPIGKSQLGWKIKAKSERKFADNNFKQSEIELLEDEKDSKSNSEEQFRRRFFLS